MRKMTVLAVLPFSLAFLLAACGGGGGSSPAPQGVTTGAPIDLFYEPFDGTAIDPVRWDVSLATSGVRYFLPGPNDTEASWGDPSTLQAPPYGAILVSGGTASFSSGLNRAFPFIFVAPPGRPCPFPAQGDFTFEFRMRWDKTARQGPWILLTARESSVPAGTCAFYREGETVFGIENCAWRGARVFTPGVHLGDDPPHGELGIAITPFCDIFAMNTFRLTCQAGAYTLTINDQVVFGPVASPLRPKNILVGGWAVTTWEFSEWSCFTLDSIRVTVHAPPPSVLEVGIDIKPGGEGPAPINLGAQGTLPVAILGSAQFDASTVDPATILLAGAPVALKRDGSRQVSLEDVNSDGFPDLVAHIDNPSLQLEEDADEAELTASTFGGEAVSGSHPVRIVP